MKRLVLGIALAAGLAACSGSNTPGAVTEQFFRKLESGDCNGIQDYLSANSRAAAGQKIEQVCTLGSAARKADPAKAQAEGIKTFRIADSKEEGDRATVRFEAESNNGQKANDTVHLVREDGRWKIDLTAGGGGMGGGMGAGPSPSATPPVTAPTPAPTAPSTTTTTTTNTTSTTDEGTAESNEQ